MSQLERNPCRLALAVVLLLGAPARADESAANDFQKHIAPLLETRCLRCHSAAKASGKLVLETAEAVARGGESGRAVVPGKPAESLLLDMIKGDNPAMPEGGPALSADEVARFRQWIAAGAEWPEGVQLTDRAATETWWSLAPLQRPNVPVTDSGWPRNDVDRFILAELESHQLHPAPEVDRRALIRRLSYDLHGLPPTPEELESFLSDSAPDAYERLVDRLLASPRYGERWARRWLDVVHYGETHGYDKDKRRDNAWPYRDYVIASFNADKPYAKFVREQLAGDALWPDDPQAVVATGFIAAGPWDFVGHVELREGTVEKAKTRNLDRDDMVTSTLSTFVSMTAHCARCHDHKFDPIPQADYYRLQAVFAGVDRADRPYPDPEQAAKRDRLTARLEHLQARKTALDSEAGSVSSPELMRLDAQIADMRDRIRAIPDPFVSADDKPVTSPTNGYHSAISAKQNVTKWVQLDLGTSQPISVIRLIPARPTDFPDTPGFGFPLRYLVQVSDDAEFGTHRLIADERDEDVANPGREPVAFYLDGQPARYIRVVAERLWPRTNDFVFALAELQVEANGENLARAGKVTALDSIEAGRWGKERLIDGFDSRHELPDLAALQVAEPIKRRSELQARLQAHLRQRDELALALLPNDLRQEREHVAREIVNTTKRVAELSELPKVYSIQSHEPRKIQVLGRGDVEQPLDEVMPGGLSCVDGLSSEFALSDPANEATRRVALAGWIVDPHNVLTWRSIVNRAWHYHFGGGLVDTPNDLGRNGSLPTHPALLDWLAIEFRDGGQSFKTLDRLLVTSATYRQQTRHDDEAARIDGGNQYLWRMNRQRLDAESLRDALLAVSGKLDPTMGGPSFELFAFKDDHSPRYDPVPIDEPRVWRRTIYRYITRSVPNPFLETLDCPDPSFSAPVRSTTITALQALTTLNNFVVLRHAEYFAERLEREADNRSAQVDRAYLLSFGRPPIDDERSASLTFIERYGLPNFCRLLFNANEFVFVD